MKKLTLDLDTLNVESFELSPARKRREGGTVKAHEYSDIDCYYTVGNEFGPKRTETDYTFCGSCYNCGTNYSCPTQRQTECGTCAFPVCQPF